MVNAVSKKTHLYFLSDEPWAYTDLAQLIEMPWLALLYHSAVLHTIFI